MSEVVRDIRAFWDSRAGLGEWAGTRDVIAKQLEIEAIASFVRDGMKVLEIGCGNGITAIELAKRYRVEIEAIDFAAGMIAAANDLLAGQELRGRVGFRVGDVRDGLGRLSAGYDLIYTERVLINLPDWPAQRQAIREITALLAEGGLYVMCENSQDGLDRINALRRRVDLPEITPPWHNRYLRDAEIEQMDLPGVVLEGVHHFSSTYYLLSRVVNAWLAAQAGEEPDYEAPVNRLALQLPAIGELGQGRIWLWRSHGKRAERPGEHK
jgi:ubiquinone/menaquinone biosynthesis C-methylase UbiE